MDLIFRLLVLAVLAIVALAVLARLGSRFRTTIFEYERGLRFSRGRFTRVLEPGVHWSLPAFVRLQRVDVRPTRAVVAGQEVLSRDGVAVKGSVMATYQVVDPQKALLATDDFKAAVYSELQLALRAVISETGIDDLLQQRAEIPARLKAISGEKIRALGVELQDASLRDLTFPGELKKIFMQVVKARQEGLAALEKARGETAALRNLATRRRWWSAVRRCYSFACSRCSRSSRETPSSSGCSRGAHRFPCGARARLRTCRRRTSRRMAGN
jgi:regulator of protease activity HflC (stomatin/prohibitin superfamily)